MGLCDSKWQGQGDNSHSQRDCGPVVCTHSRRCRSLVSYTRDPLLHLQAMLRAITALVVSSC